MVRNSRKYFWGETALVYIYERDLFICSSTVVYTAWMCVQGVAEMQILAVGFLSKLLQDS